MTGSGMTDEEEIGELKAAVREFFAAKSAEEAVRKVMETEPRYDPAVWAQICEQLRLPALAIPERFGGDGYGLRELAGVFEEAGRALLCSPLFATAALAAQALLASADEAACALHLPDLAAGRRTGTLAVAEKDGFWDPATIRTRAIPSDDGWRLSGTKSFVIDGASADLILVVARTVAGPSLFAVDRDAPGLTAEPMVTLDPTRAMARLDLIATPAVLVGVEGGGGRLIENVLDVSSVLLAAEQAGGARRCLEMSTGYALTRVQFGRQIGSFQAVKHKCADMLVSVELAEASAREAARLAGTADFSVAAATAHACCSRAYMSIAQENIQVHGGIGFTWEHPAHLYFRRAKASELLFGGPALAYERLLDRLGL
jgi:alkylation response protein AidB-like acyl-CoA dehydrogenase